LEAPPRKNSPASPWKTSSPLTVLRKGLGNLPWRSFSKMSLVLTPYSIFESSALRHLSLFLSLFLFFYFYLYLYFYFYVGYVYFYFYF
jgi:hypothetical protein